MVSTRVAAMGWGLCLLAGLGCGSEDGGGAAGSAGAAGAGGTIFAGAGGAAGSAGSGGNAGSAGSAGSGGSAGNAGAAGTGGAECTPDAARFASDIAPILEQRCVGCHTTPPQFGAPFALTDYAALVSGTPGARIVDRIVAQLGNGTMPPAGNIRPTPDEHDTIVDWASCGTNTPPYPTSLVSDRPIFEADEAPPAGAERIELTAQGFSVPDGTKDQYQQFVFSNVVTSEKFVRRFDVTIDKSRVVHHITLHYANPGNDSYLYAWAPGTGAVQFPSGGLRVRPSDQFRVEIHYNNLSGEGSVNDSSGVVLFVEDPSGTEYAMLDPNTFAILVPPGSMGQAQANCTAGSDFTILAGMPHMHEIGDTYSHKLMRMDGSTESIVELSGWSFDLQFFYRFDVDVKAGDTMTIRCGYVNDKNTSVIGGLGTTDEMCYNFMYVTPADAVLTCQ